MGPCRQSENVLAIYLRALGGMIDGNGFGSPFWGSEEPVPSLSKRITNSKAASCHRERWSSRCLTAQAADVEKLACTRS